MRMEPRTSTRSRNGSTTSPEQRWIVFSCAAILLSQILDATTFAAYCLFGDAAVAEQNPIVRFLFVLGGPLLVVTVKLAFGYAAWTYGRRYTPGQAGSTARPLLVVLPAVAIYTCIGAAFNTFALMQIR